MANLRDLMKELDFEVLTEGPPTSWGRHANGEEVLVGQMSDGEIHVTKSVPDQLPIVIRLNKFDGSLEALLRSWLTVNA